MWKGRPVEGERAYTYHQEWITFLSLSLLASPVSFFFYPHTQPRQRKGVSGLSSRAIASLTKLSSNQVTRQPLLSRCAFTSSSSSSLLLQLLLSIPPLDCNVLCCPGSEWERVNHIPGFITRERKKKKEFLSDSLGLMSRHSWPCNKWLGTRAVLPRVFHPYSLCSYYGRATLGESHHQGSK